MPNCPCASGNSLDSCCGPFLSGVAAAPTAEKLMRSRYTAFCYKNFKYLSDTTDPQTRAIYATDENEKWAESVEFLKLEILNYEESGNKGKVEFVAHFKLLADGSLHTHHEISKFRQQANKWYYREGKII